MHLPQLFRWQRSPAQGPEIPASFESRRLDMVETQLRARGILDQAVLSAMGRVPRHEFLASPMRHAAYEDRALPLGEWSTLSQPYIVARTLEALALAPGMHVLDVGLGSGYQAAVLLEMGCIVWGIELDEELCAAAARRLDRLGYRAIEVKAGDGRLGWPEHAPFDAIVVAAATPEAPPALLRQLRQGGRMVAPVGCAEEQMLKRFTRTSGTHDVENLLPVRFVEMR